MCHFKVTWGTVTHPINYFQTSGHIRVICSACLQLWVLGNKSQNMEVSRVNVGPLIYMWMQVAWAHFSRIVFSMPFAEWELGGSVDKKTGTKCNFSLTNRLNKQMLEPKGREIDWLKERVFKKLPSNGFLVQSKGQLLNTMFSKILKSDSEALQWRWSC